MANYIPDPSSPHFDPMMLTTNVIGKAYRAAILYNKTRVKGGLLKLLSLRLVINHNHQMYYQLMVLTQLIRVGEIQMIGITLLFVIAVM